MERGKPENPEKTDESREKPNKLYSHVMPSPGIKPETPEVRRVYYHYFEKRLIGEGLIACCIPSPKCEMVDVNPISERSQQEYGNLSDFFCRFFQHIFFCADIIYI